MAELFAAASTNVNPLGLAGGFALLGFSRNQENIARKLSVSEDKIASAIEARNAARKARNFAESDRIRDELAAMGVVLKDTKEGTTWEIAR